MPQMNPIWWVTLAIVFITTTILINSINYFYKNINMNKKYVFIKNKDYVNWKW
uniref:ATP synthase complex subunit 8 n=1 Tax=Teliapsocus conterminus TaxID=1407779 RepID=A0A8K1ZG83_9NEOP|nr:ATP synthase F0 subunit 8 [Teliapsocus conterminus]